MAIGSFMGRVFTVSHTKIFTPSNLKGSTGSDWATHEVVGGKARSEWVGPETEKLYISTFYCGRRTVLPRAVRLIISSVWRRAAPWIGLWWEGFHFRPTRSRSRT